MRTPAFGNDKLSPRILLGVLVTAVYAAAVQYFWGWEQLFRPWQEIGVPHLLGALLLMTISYLLRTFRVLDFFAVLSGRRLLPGLKLVLLHNLFNGVLPMRSGELSFPVLMSAYFRITPGRSLPGLMWLRLLDLHTVAALALLAILPSMGSPGLAALTLWVLSAPLVYPMRGGMLSWVGRREGAPARILEQVLEGLPATWGGLLRALMWTWANWALKIAVLAWVLGQFIQVPTTAAWWGAIGGDLTSVLPVHAPAGFGTYEVGVVAGLVPWGVEAEPALQAAVNLHLFLLLAMALGGGIALLLPGRRAKDRSSSVG